MLTKEKKLPTREVDKSGNQSTSSPVLSKVSNTSVANLNNASGVTTVSYAKNNDRKGVLI